ncbi:MAG: VanZ family protein [Thiohalocapsa sp.]|jgi:VanZ family protein
MRVLSGLALAGCMLTVAYLAFAPLEQPPGFSWDKANHVLAFVVMALFADGAYPGRRRELPRWGLLIGYGLAIELIQSGLPYRYFSWLDLAADAAGILLYVVARHVLLRRSQGPRAARRASPRVLSRRRRETG